MRRIGFVVNGEKTVTFSRISKERLVVVISSNKLFHDTSVKMQEGNCAVEAFLARLIRWAEKER